MKKILSILIVFTVLVSGVKANTEKPTSEAGLAVMKSKTGFRILYRADKKSDIRITIYNSDGAAIHKETLRNTDNFVRPYNLASMREGDYTIVVRDGAGAQVKKVNYSKSRSEIKAKLAPIPGEANKYVLSLAKTEGVTSVNVRILDDQGKIVYTTTEDATNDSAKVYDLSKVTRKFSVQLSADNGVSKLLTN
jgi:hypothetical protein